MNEAWFSKIYDLYNNEIYRLAFSYTHNSSDADDITQKVFIKFFSNIDKINQNEIEVKKWLIIATINTCKDLFKSFWKKRVISFDDKYEFMAKENNMDKFFEECLKRLPKKYRLVFHLYYYLGYTTKEIAILMKMKESTVRQKLARGRKILKIEMEDIYV